MRWYQGLFFKSFLAVWLTSSVVLVAVILVVGIATEERNEKKVHHERMKWYATTLIERFEQRQSRINRFFETDRFPVIPLRTRFPIQIFEEDTGVLIAGPRELPDHHRGDLVEIEVESDSGRDYIVRKRFDKKRSPFHRLIGLVISVQMVMILTVSALASLLMTWMIVRPVNRLRSHAQVLYSGDLSARSDAKLNSRKDEIGELAREFDRMAEFVEQTLNANQRLLQDVSHELRAPLARLQAASGLAEQQLGEDSALMQRINRETDRLNQLIGEILSLSRIDTIEVTGEPFQLETLIEELQDDYRFSAPQRQLRFQAPAGLPPLSLNRQLLHRVLDNLISNAVKYTPEESAIDVTVNRSAQELQISVRDHGNGVDDQALPRLFEAFYRQSSDSAGYGLGLSIVSRIINRLGGSVTAQNHPEGGLEVILELPN